MATKHSYKITFTRGTSKAMNVTVVSATNSTYARTAFFHSHDKSCHIKKVEKI